MLVHQFKIIIIITLNYASGHGMLGTYVAAGLLNEVAWASYRHNTVIPWLAIIFHESLYHFNNV